MGNNEEFDKNSVAVGKFDLAKPEENRIAIGNLKISQTNRFL